MAFRKVLDRVSVVIVLGAIVVGVLRLAHRKPPGTDADGVPRRSVPAAVLAAAATGHRLGPANAAVTILVFWDHACSWCRAFAEPLRLARTRYPEHVAVIMKHFVVLDHGPATDMALASECAAEQGAFEAFHEVAARNPQLSAAKGGWLAVGDSVGLTDSARYGSCVESAAHAARVESDYDDGSRLGVQVTPTFFINGEIHEGSVSYPRLDSLIARHLMRNRGG